MAQGYSTVTARVGRNWRCTSLKVTNLLQMRDPKRDLGDASLETFKIGASLHHGIM